MGDEKVKVDRGTLQEYADGPLDDAIGKMRKALGTLDGDASPASTSHPAVGQDAAAGHQEAAGSSSETMSGCMEVVVSVLERLQDTIKEYASSEQDNTESADDIPADQA